MLPLTPTPGLRVSRAASRLTDERMDEAVGLEQIFHTAHHLEPHGESPPAAGAIGAHGAVAAAGAGSAEGARAVS